MRKVKNLFRFVVFLSAIIGGYLFWLSDKYVIPIMMYHSIDVPEKSTGTTVSPRRFRQHMEYLKSHHYRVINLAEMVEAIKENKPLPQKSVVITFDDGYDDNYVYAFPILKEFGFPATIFVIANVVGDNGYLTWPQIKEMEQFGITIGSHTLDHTYLPGVPLVWQNHQIVGSKEVLEEKLGHPILYIAYPSGGFSDAIKEMVKKAGYKGACTTNRGYVLLNRDIFELKRIRFKDTDSALGLWIKLSGFYNFFKTPRDPN